MPSNNQRLRILQVGLGGFGKNHLQAWSQMGLASQLWVADPAAIAEVEARKANLPRDRLITDFHKVLDQVDVVDVVTPTQSHASIVGEALRAGKHVFVEKPMTLTTEEAIRLADQARSVARILQVGYYYRFHPISLEVRDRLRRGTLGNVRYIDGRFFGLKRARTDVGVTKTDAVHFIDLFNWWLGAPPDEAYAVVRDHWDRGMEDFSLVVLRYPGGTVVKVESGYIQPGRWRDKVVPDAMTSKEVSVCGTEGVVEVDFETEVLNVHDTRHELRNGTWWPTFRGTTVPNVGTATPVHLVQRELGAFLEATRTGQHSGPGPVASGVVIARILDAIYASAMRGQPQPIRWTNEEVAAVAAEGPLKAP